MSNVPRFQLGGNYIPDRARGKVFELYGVASHSYGNAHADYTLTDNEAEASLITVTLADGGANLILGVAKPGKIYILYNNSGQTITFKVSGQSGASLANGKYGIYVCNATDIIEILEQS